ncbi:MAG: tetratricopeptide repeat protein [Bacteroidales bacterium]|nr:tetratricopeptide repeat protein [Bacteroidales bacterium]
MRKQQVKSPVTHSFLTNVRTQWIIVLLFPFALYWNTAFNKYALDDHLVIEQNEQVQKGFRGIGAILTSPYAEEEGLVYGYRPLVKISYAIEVGIFGENPGINHLLSVLWFALAMLVLFKVLLRIFKHSPPLFPFIITLLYTAHPLNTEIVASLKNRDEIFMLLFSFLALYQALKYCDYTQVKHLAGAGLLFLLALLAKNTALPFLFIIPLTIGYATLEPRKPIIRVSIVLLCAFFVFFFIPKLLFNADVRPVEFYENPLFFETDFSIKLGTAAGILLFYLKQILFPLQLSFYYGYDTLPLLSVFAWQSVLSGIIHLALLVAAIAGMKKKRTISYGIWVYLIGIALYSNLPVPAPGMVADRFAIVALLGFAVVLATGIFRLFSLQEHSNPATFRKQVFILLTSLAVILPYGIKTFTRNREWRTYLSLYAADLPHLSRSVKANMLYAQALTAQFYYNNQLGVNLRENERYISLIEKHYQQALEVYPENYDALSNFGSFYAYNLNRWEEAERWFKKATALQPGRYEAWFNRGYAFQMTGQPDAALEAYNKALEAAPGHPEIMAALGELYFKQGNTEQAIAMNRRILQNDPKNIAAYTNIGNYYIFRSDTLSAIAFWEEAVKIYPHKQLLVNLSYLHKQYGNEQKSLYYYRQSEKVK